MPNTQTTNRPTAFRKGDKRKKGRPPGTQNIVSAEVKEILTKMFHEGLNGYDGFMKWVKQKDHLTLFYTKMWIKMLPMQVNVNANIQREYKSYHDLTIAFSNEGITLDSIEKLKQIDLVAKRLDEKFPES